MSSATPAVKEEEYPLQMRAAVIVFLFALAVLGVSSSRQVAAESRTVPFPLGTDVDYWNLGEHYPYWIMVGDSVSGTRSIDITEINEAEIHLELSVNEASNTVPHVFEVSLNSQVVGEFSVRKSDGPSITTVISFGPIDTHGSLEIQYKLVQCGLYSGIVIIAEGSSTLTLSDGLAPKTKKDFALQALGKLEDLRNSVDQSDIDQGPKRSLLSKLDRAIAKVDQAIDCINNGNEQKADNKLGTARNSVLSFIKAVKAFSDRIAPYGVGWQDDANRIIELIETAIETPLL